MTTNPTKRHVPPPARSVIAWLLDGDPAIRWQTMRDLTAAPVDEVAAARARVATEGWGARLLALQAPDGRWSCAAWNREWNSTMHVLMLLRAMGLDPASNQAQRAVGRVRDGVTWQGCGPPECDDNPFFAGELEPCINGQVGAVGAYFGQDVQGIIDRLLGEQLADGGWNCEAANGSTRASFNTTICVLEALLEHELHVGSSPPVTVARRRGEAYLLARRLCRRSPHVTNAWKKRCKSACRCEAKTTDLSSGDPAGQQWLVRHTGFSGTNAVTWRRSGQYGRASPRATDHESNRPGGAIRLYASVAAPPCCFATVALSHLATPLITNS